MTIEVGLDSSALVKGVEEGTRALRALSEALGKLDKASLTKLKADLASLKGSPLEAVQTLAKSMEGTLAGAFDSLGRIRTNKLQDIAKQLKTDGNAIARILQDTNEAIAKQTEASARALEDANNNLDKKLSVRQKAIKAATKAYEDMVLNDPERRVTPKGEAALYRMMQAGAQMSPTHVNIAKSWAQSYRDEAKEIEGVIAFRKQEASKFARTFTLDDTRSLLGLPSVSDMKTFTASIRNQILGRDQSASRFTLEDTRSLLGLPSASDMKTFTASIKSQMLGRDGSASKFTFDDTRSLLGLPSLDEIKTLSTSIKNQMLGRDKSASKFTLDDTRHLLGLPSVDEIKALSTSIKNQMLGRDRSASKFTLDDTRNLLGLPSISDMKTFTASIRNQMLGRDKSTPTFSLEDTRSLLGLPPIGEMRNFASALKRQLTERAKSAAPMSLDDTRAMLGLPPLASIERIKADMLGRMNDLYDKAQEAGIKRRQIMGDFSPYNAKMIQADASKASRSMNAQIMGPFSPYDSRAALKELEASKPSALGTAIRKLGDDMGYTHSMARGLTSGLGLLWLTWGAMIPIFTGAAISNALMTTAKAGMEVEQNLMKIHVLGGEASKDVSQLSIKMLELAKNGPAGPKEISAAMKTLSLAGLQASEVYEAIKPVLNFSVAGDTTIEKSADVLSSVATAYKYTAKDYAYIADIISVAAASSKASVETMGEAFKSSSVVFTKFGVTLEDTALVMAMLNNVGVQGTAAGTAYRNMLTDLTGRTEKSKKALSELGMSMSDVVNKSGKMKPLEDIFAKIVKGLERKSGGEQFDILNRLFTERGDKGAIEMLTNLRKVAEESGITIVQAYQKLQTEINNASGFTVIAAAKMSQTSTNAIKMALSSMEAAFVESFNTMRPYIVEVAGELRKIFQSEGFRSSLETLIEIVGTLVKGFFEWSKAIGLVLSGFLAFKGMALAMGSLAAAYETVKVAVTGATGAMVAFNGAQALFLKSPLGLFLTGVALAVVGVTAAWKTFSSSTRDAAKSVDTFNGTNIDELLKSLESERDRLVKVNEARQRKISLMALEAELAVIQLRSQEPPEIRDLAAKVAAYKPINVPDNANGGSEARMRSGLAESAHKQNVAELARLRQEYQDKITKAEQTAKAVAIWEKTLAGPARVPGDDNPTFPHKPDKIGKMPHGLGYKEENPVTLLKQQMQDQIAIVEIYRKADVISHAQAEENKYQITVEYENAAKKALNDKWKKTQEIFLKEYAAAKGNKERQQALLEASQSQALEYNDSYMSVVSESNRRQIQYNEELAVSAAKVTRAYDKFLRGKEAEVSEEEAKAAIYRANKRMYPEIVAQQEAQLKYYAEFDKSIAELKESYDLMREAQILAFASGDESRVIMFGAQAEKVAQAMRNARRDKELIAKRSGDAAYRKTLEDEYGKFVDEFSLSLADGVATAIMDGGKQGGDKLRKYLQDLLIRKPMVLFLEAQVKGLFGGTGGVNGTGLLQDLSKFSTGRMFETASAATDVAASWTDAMASFVIGGRASGGTVNPNSMYRVNENGIEMLSAGGKDYLLTGAQQGSITPAGQTGVNISYAPQINIDSRADQGQVMALVSRAVQAGNAKLIDDLRQARVI